METITKVIPPELNGATVRHVLKAHLRFSTHAVARLTRAEGGIRLNGGHIRTVDIVHTGDVLTAEIGDRKPLETEIIPCDWPLEIVYEDEYQIAVKAPEIQLVEFHHQWTEPDGTVVQG